MKMQKRTYRKRTYRKRRTHGGATPAPGAQYIGYKEAKYQAPYNKSGGRGTRRRGGGRVMPFKGFPLLNHTWQDWGGPN